MYKFQSVTVSNSLAASWSLHMSAVPLARPQNRHVLGDLDGSQYWWQPIVDRASQLNDHLTSAKTVIIVKACSVCKHVVRTALDDLGIPYDAQLKKNSGANILTIQMRSPSTYTPGSLQEICWNKQRMPYHATFRDGNTIGCTSARNA
ncbi:hypothetical protein VTK56DRAFT_10158 [Thermocarpiscus australiensis]